MTKQERAARTRRSLIRAAAEHFEAHGYVQAKLADISSGAGVSPGALHFHFENKAAVAATVEAAAAVDLRRAGSDAQDPATHALHRLAVTTRALADELARNVVARAGFRLNCESAHRTGLDLLQEWRDCVQRLLVEAEHEGLLEEPVTRPDLLVTVVAATTGFEVLSRHDSDWLSGGTLDGFWHTVLPGVAGGSPHEQDGPESGRRM